MTNATPENPRRRAEENPWYVLATLHGVPDPVIRKNDDTTQSENRRDWNRLMAGRLTDVERNTLIDEEFFSADDMTVLAEDELKNLKRLFRQRGGDDLWVFGEPSIQDPQIDFSDLDFDQGLDATGFIFAGSVSFRGARFFKQADFTDATFYRADFADAIFSDRCPAMFEQARFMDFSSFEGSTFMDTAQFAESVFDVVAFDRSQFKKLATFYDATFIDLATFADVQFNGPIFFGPATFKSKPPEFFQTKLHQDTDFHQVKWPPGPKKSRDATQFVRAFECLKLEMDRLKRHEDELTFFAFELKGRRALEGRWKALLIALYGCLCDYGRSSFRPLLGLVITIVVGALLFLPHFGVAEYEKAFGISFANAFAILGYRKDFVGVETIGKLSNLLIAVSSIETVVGAVLLFLFGLALRNGFRMR